MGFLDISKILESNHPELNRRNELCVCKSFLGKEPSDGKTLNALEIKELYIKAKPSDIMPFTFDVMYIEEELGYRKQKADNLKTWLKLIPEYISRDHAGRAAGSGLRLQHLIWAYELGGSDAVKRVLTEKVEDGKIRVMNQPIKIDQLMAFFDQLG